MDNKFKAFFMLLKEREEFQNEFKALNDQEKISVKNFCRNVAKRNNIKILADFRIFEEKIHSLILKKRKEGGEIMSGPLGIIEHSVYEAGKLLVEEKT